jgi:hypothetical protein
VKGRGKGKGAGEGAARRDRYPAPESAWSGPLPEESTRRWMGDPFDPRGGRGLWPGPGWPPAVPGPACGWPDSPAHFLSGISPALVEILHTGDDGRLEHW